MEHPKQSQLNQLILDKTVESYHLLDANGTLIDVNPAYCNLLGYTREELLGRHISELVPYLRVEKVKNRIRTALREGQIQFESRHQHKNGYTIDIEASVSVLQLDEKPYLAVFLRDISERKQTEKALKQSEAQLAAASHIGKIAYWEYDPAKDIFTFNDPFYAIFGTTADEVGGYQLSAEQYAARFIHPDEYEIVQKHVETAMAAKNANFNEGFSHKMLYANGEIGYITVYHYLRKNDEGFTVKTYGAVQDITEAMQTELDLKRTNSLLKSIREVNKLTYTEKDADSLVSKAVQNLVKDRDFLDARVALIDENGTLGRIEKPEKNQSLMPENIADWIQTLISTEQKSKRTIQFEENRYDFDSESIEFTTLAIPMSYKERRYGFLLVTATQNQINRSEEQMLASELANDLAIALFTIELEEQKAKVVQDLVKAKERAEAANIAKDEFLAVISHEIRTPLNPIIGYTNLLQQKDPDEQSAQYLNAIFRAANRQLALIDNILSFTRLNSGELTPSWSDFNIYELCQNAATETKDSNTHLTIDFLDDKQHQAIPYQAMVRGEKSMLQELLANLLSNACKYTKEGRVTFRVGYEPSECHPARFHFSIQDTGIGISQNMQERLFSAFTQEDTSYTRNYEGAGLGLAICKKLVDMLNGEIGVESTLGKGSRFWFTLPMEIMPDAEPVQTKTAKPDLHILNQRKVLLVEDKKDSLAFTTLLLEQHGASVTTAHNGHAAVNACSEQAFDVVLMDLAMPGLSGLDATRLIRSARNENQAVPIIPLTADVSPEARKNCSIAKMNGYLTKPLNVGELSYTLQRFLRAK